jgi:quinohemoprotein amine dehydrogenase
MARQGLGRVSGSAWARLIVGLVICGSSVASAQRGGRGGAGRGSGAGGQADTTTGFVIHDQSIINACSDCHARDSAGYMQRVSYERKTPEGWEMSVRRMMALNGVKIDAATARAIVRYLSDHQGLAPSELRPGRFEVERRMVDYRYTADTRTETTCRACHSMGRVITERRTRGEWELLISTHRALYPDVDFQAFRRGGPAPDTGAVQPHPMDAAIAHLARAFPLRTPEWAAWSATMRPPRLEGTWVLSGTEPGRGAFFGRMMVTRGATDGEFTTQASYRYANGGPPVQRTGRAIVYTGFQWRGRSTDQQRARDSASLREVMFVEPGWQEMSGRWFSGGYDELGMDVSLKRLSSNIVVAGVAPRALQSGMQHEVTVLGANLPRDVNAAGLDFGPGVHVQQIIRATSDSITVRVSVDSAAPVGARDLFAAGASLRDAAVVYDKISRIKVTPLAGLARTGGVVFPKQLQQFDAFAYHNGADGKPDTDDDIEIGRVDATWSLEEYQTTYDDDDVKYVGSVDAKGLFTPNADGPNPARAGNRNNVGDIWVVATYQPPGKNAKPLKARAHLVVTVPLYVRFVPWKTQP